MPIYEYEDRRTGEVVELFRNYSERDDVPKHLKRIPSMPGLVYGFTPLPTDGESTIKALSKYEDSVGRQEIERQTGFSADELKKVWTAPHNNEPVKEDESAA